MTDVTVLPEKSNIWWVFLLQGIAGIVLGLMLITEPEATMVALTTVLGFYWLITGVLALVQVLWIAPHRGSGPSLAASSVFWPGSLSCDIRWWPR